MKNVIQQRNEGAAMMWSSGGAAYDNISRQIASALDHCVCRLVPKLGERLLDLATGTGWTARLLARHGAKVTGVDIASELIAAARTQGAPEGGTITYEIGDAEALLFNDGAFDGVTSTFGIMFASRPDSVAGELVRVCRPGGRIALVVWRDDSNLVKMFEVMRHYMPPLPDTAPPSPFAWGNRACARELLGNAFDLTFEEGVTVDHDCGGRAAWVVISECYGPTKMLAKTLEPDRAAAVESDSIRLYDGVAGPLGNTVPQSIC